MMDELEKGPSETIGYSAFRPFDECYEYNENACYIADTPELLRAFLTNALFSVNDYETVVMLHFLIYSMTSVVQVANMLWSLKPCRDLRKPLRVPVSALR